MNNGHNSPALISSLVFMLSYCLLDCIASQPMCNKEARFGPTSMNLLCTARHSSVIRIFASLRCLMLRRTAARRNTANLSRLLISLKLIFKRRSITESSRSNDLAEIDCLWILTLLRFRVKEGPASTKSPSSLRRNGSAISDSISRRSRRVVCAPPVCISVSSFSACSSLRIWPCMANIWDCEACRDTT